MQIVTSDPPWQAHETINFGGQKVNGQGHIRSEIWRPGRGTSLDRIESSRFANFL